MAVGTVEQFFGSYLIRLIHWYFEGWLIAGVTVATFYEFLWQRSNAFLIQESWIPKPLAKRLTRFVEGCRSGSSSRTRIEIFKIKAKQKSFASLRSIYFMISVLRNFKGVRFCRFSNVLHKGHSIAWKCFQTIPDVNSLMGRKPFVHR